MAPRPVTRPPVDDASQRTFGRPDGVDGSFVAEQLRPPKYRDNDEYTPRDQRPDPVLAEAFGRPVPGGESLQRHPIDAGALDGGDDGPEEPDDPWRDPGAPAALGTPAVAETAPHVAAAPTAALASGLLARLELERNDATAADALAAKAVETLVAPGFANDRADAVAPLCLLGC